MMRVVTDGSAAPVSGSSTAKAAEGCPLAVLKEPPTAILPSGSTSMALTWLFRAGRKDGSHSPVATSKAAR